MTGNCLKILPCNFKGNVVRTLNQVSQKSPVAVQHTQRDHHSWCRQTFHLSGSAFDSDSGLTGEGRIPEN